MSEITVARPRGEPPFLFLTVTFHGRRMTRYGSTDTSDGGTATGQGWREPPGRRFRRRPETGASVMVLRASEGGFAGTGHVASACKRRPRRQSDQSAASRSPSGSSGTIGACPHEGATKQWAPPSPNCRPVSTWTGRPNPCRRLAFQCEKCYMAQSR